MGLDMYFTAKHNGISEELCYFRKHADLHGKLQEIWCMKTGKNPEDFNCASMRITKAILKELKEFANTPDEYRSHYVGFFWGTSTPEKWERTFELFDDIEECFKQNKRVYYSADW